MFSLLSLLLLLQCDDDALALHPYLLRKAAMPLLHERWAGGRDAMPEGVVWFYLYSSRW